MTTSVPLALAAALPLSAAEIPPREPSPILSAVKTKHTAGLIAVVLVFLVDKIPGWAQEGVSSPASEPATQGETNQTLHREDELIRVNRASHLRRGGPRLHPGT